MKQTDFGIKPPGKAGVRAKDEVRIEFDIRLASSKARKICRILKLVLARGTIALGSNKKEGFLGGAQHADK